MNSHQRYEQKYMLLDKSSRWYLKEIENLCWSLDLEFLKNFSDHDYLRERQVFHIFYIEVQYQKRETHLILNF